MAKKQTIRKEHPRKLKSGKVTMVNQHPMRYLPKDLTKRRKALEQMLSRIPGQVADAEEEAFNKLLGIEDIKYYHDWKVKEFISWAINMFGVSYVYETPTDVMYSDLQTYIMYR